MSIDKDEALLKLFHQLPETDQKSTFDFMQYLAHRKQQTELERFYANLPEVDEPFSEEELRQLNSDEGFVSGEEAKREFSLKVDLP
jgi:hypothetical protein